MEKEKNQNYWESIRNFNISRTPFWKGFTVILISTIIPIILIWFFFGYDFHNYKFSLFNSLPSPKTAYVSLILLLGVLIYSIVVITIFTLTKVVKADIYTYSFGFWLGLTSLVLNGSWMKDIIMNDALKIIIRFILVLLAACIGTFIGIIFTIFFRNWQYKKEEEDYIILQTYRNGQNVPSKKLLKIEKIEQAEIRRKREKEELENFKKELNKRLIIQYDEMNEKKKLKKEKINYELDLKENKKRMKENKKSNI